MNPVVDLAFGNLMLWAGQSPPPPKYTQSVKLKNKTKNNRKSEN